MVNLVVLLVMMAFQEPAQISGIVQDENGQPVAGVEVVLHSPNAGVTERSFTDDLGKFRFDAVVSSPYTLDFNRTGFFRLSGYALDVKPGSNEITVGLNHEYELRSTLDVLSTPHEIVPEQMRHEEQLAGYEIRENPVPSSHNLQNSLPALPQVVQDNTGQLHVAGARSEDTLYLLDDFQLNNPATGTLDARVNVDAVREANMSTGRYGAQFANAGTGVLGLQTDTGDDHWRFRITNFVPSLSTQRGLHLGNWFPRVNFSGPLKEGRAWFSEAASEQHDFNLVRELPPGSDISEQWSTDNLLRGQYNITRSQALQGNFLYNGSLATRVGLTAFSPASTTLDVHAHRYFVSARDQITINNGLIEIGVASDTNHVDRLPQGTQAYLLTPTGPRGNYFERQIQNSSRWQGLVDAVLSGRQWHGAHELRFGLNIDRTHLDQASDRSPVDVEQTDLTIVRQVTFLGNGSVSISARQTGGFAQDAWQLRRDLILQSSFRVDENDIIGKLNPQPRFILNWIPRRGTSKFSVGWGFYYQPIYLSLIGQAHDQSRRDVLIDPQQSSTVPVLTSFGIGRDLRQPFFEMASAEWQQQWNGRTSTAVHLMQRTQHHGLSYEDVSNDPLVRDIELRDRRNDRYDAVEFMVRRTLGEGSDVMVDYTHSRARSNQIFNYSVGDLVIARQSGGRLPWDAPNRVISRGAFPTRIWALLFTYFADYHTGFPFSAVNSQYVVVRVPNSYRYPTYFTLNVGAEKRFPFYGRQWALRLAVINLTGHHSFDTVSNNIDAPNFGTFAGGQSRAFTFRLRLVGRS
jgi:Carboxypeptidase regulatory-like domain